MTDPRETLARIRKQADNATEGPWEAFGTVIDAITGPGDCRGCSGILSPAHEPACYYSEIAGAGERDAEFIAASRTTVPALLDALEKVLELHSPLAGRPSWDGDIRCSGCYDSYYDVYEPYPCELVKAITTALEGENR